MLVVHVKIRTVREIGTNERHKVRCVCLSFFVPVSRAVLILNMSKLHFYSSWSKLCLTSISFHFNAALNFLFLFFLFWYALVLVLFNILYSIDLHCAVYNLWHVRLHFGKWMHGGAASLREVLALMMF